MNLRWLLGNFTDPQFKLPVREQFRLSKVGHDRYLARGPLLLRTAIIVSPVMLLFASLNPVLRYLGLADVAEPMFVGVGAILVFTWVWSAWMYRSLYVGPIRKAMREAGYDLCINCGYELRGLDASITRCPECGNDRESGPPVQ